MTNASTQAIIAALTATFTRAFGAPTAAIFKEELANATRPTPDEVQQGYQDGHEALVGFATAASAFAKPDRLPPSNQQAEQALLGALLANNAQVRQARKLVTADYFVDPIHALIFTAIVDKVDVGLPADAVTLQAEFEGSDALAEVGGSAYLAVLLANFMPHMPIANLAAAIHHSWVGRHLLVVCEDLQALASEQVDKVFNGSEDAGVLASQLTRSLQRLLVQSLALSKPAS